MDPVLVAAGLAAAALVRAVRRRLRREEDEWEDEWEDEEVVEEPLRTGAQLQLQRSPSAAAAPASLPQRPSKQHSQDDRKRRESQHRETLGELRLELDRAGNLHSNARNQLEETRAKHQARMRGRLGGAHARAAESAASARPAAVSSRRTPAAIFTRRTRARRTWCAVSTAADIRARRCRPRRPRRRSCVRLNTWSPRRSA